MSSCASVHTHSMLAQSCALWQQKHCNFFHAKGGQQLWWRLSSVCVQALALALKAISHSGTGA
jgi:hypothetical protein